MINVICGTATIGSTLAGGGLVETGAGTLVLDGAQAVSVPARRWWTEGTLDPLSPLAAAPVLAGGQAIGPGTALQRQRVAQRPSTRPCSALVQSLFVDQAIDRTDMIQILQSAVVGGAVTPAALGALEMLTTPQNEARLNMPNYVAVLAERCGQRQSGQRQLPGPALGKPGGPGQRSIAGHGPERSRGQMVLWHGPARRPCVAAGVTYNVVAGSLFGDNPNPALDVPSSADMEQGAVGDCYLIAALGALADSSPAAIENMIIPNGVENGIASWTVRFYYYDPARGYVPDYVTVNAMLPGLTGGNLVYAGEGADGSWWMPLIEKAYAQWNETGLEGRDGQNTYASLNGGWMQNVDEQVLGSAATTYFSAGDPRSSRP